MRGLFKISDLLIPQGKYDDGRPHCFAKMRASVVNPIDDFSALFFPVRGKGR